MKDKVEQMAPSPTSSGVFQSVDVSRAATSSGTKRKQAPLPLSFQATKLCVQLCDFIKIHERNKSVTTGVPEEHQLILVIP